MLEYQTKVKLFTIKTRIFDDAPKEMSGCDRAYFMLCKKPDSQIEASAYKVKKVWYTKVDIDRPQDELYASFNGTTRANINRGKRALTVKIDDDWDEFKKNCEEFYKRKGFNSIEIKKREGHFLVTGYQDGKMVEGIYFAVSDETLWSVLIFSLNELDESYERICSQASRLCYYRAMIHARGMGAKSLVNSIGDDIEHPSGPGKFKLGFGGAQFQRDIYVRDYNPLAKILDKAGIWRA
jgi:hypothetical protein